MSLEYPASDESNNRNKQLFGCVAMKLEGEVWAGGGDHGGSAEPRDSSLLFEQSGGKCSPS